MYLVSSTAAVSWVMALPRACDEVEHLQTGCISNYLRGLSRIAEPEQQTVPVSIHPRANPMRFLPCFILVSSNVCVKLLFVVCFPLTLGGGKACPNIRVVVSFSPITLHVIVAGYMQLQPSLPEPYRFTLYTSSLSLMRKEGIIAFARRTVHLQCDPGWVV